MNDKISDNHPDKMTWRNDNDGTQLWAVQLACIIASQELINIFLIHRSLADQFKQRVYDLTVGVMDGDIGLDFAWEEPKDPPGGLT